MSVILATGPGVPLDQGGCLSLGLPLVPGGVYHTPGHPSDPLVEVAIEARGTHPTGMHYCYQINFSEQI